MTTPPWCREKVTVYYYYNNNNNSNWQAIEAALIADSEEKLCRLMSEFGRVCKRIELPVIVFEMKSLRSLVLA